MSTRLSHILRQITAQILLISGSLFIVLNSANAQLGIEPPKKLTPDKTINADSTETVPQDTIKRFPLKSHGQLINATTGKSISKYDIQYTNYLSINDILNDHLDVMF